MTTAAKIFHSNLICLCFSILFLSSKGQYTSGTNVDVKCLRPRWMHKNLSTLTFRNGDSITVVKNLADWKNFNGAGKKNIPAVYVRKTESGDEYYYNWYAISDKRNIAPVGYRLPTHDDFTNDINLSATNRTKAQSSEETLHIAPSGSIEWDGVNMKFYFSKEEENSLYLWLSPTGSTLDYGLTEGIRSGTNGIETHSSHSYKTCGYIVRCIEDSTADVFSKTFDYGCLLPYKFNSIIAYIENNLTYADVGDLTGDLQLKIEVSFNGKGENTCKVMNSQSVGGSEKLLYSLTSFVRSQAVCPFYTGKPLAAKTILSMKISALDKDRISVILSLLSGEVIKKFELRNTSSYKGEQHDSEKYSSSGTAKDGENGKTYSPMQEESTASNKQPSKTLKADRRLERTNREIFRVYQRKQEKDKRAKLREERRSDRRADYVINRRTVIKNYFGVSLGTAHPILQFADIKTFNGTGHSGFARTGFSASLDSYIRIKNGVGFKIKADAVNFNFDTRRYEENIMSPQYSIKDKSSRFVTPHYYLIQNLMAGFSFNIGKYKLLFEFSVLGGITTGISPVFKYAPTFGGLSMNSKRNFFIGYGYQLAGAFRIRCTSTFAIKIGATYMQSRVPQYISPVPDSLGTLNKGTLNIIAITPQISFVGMFFRPRWIFHSN